MDKPSRVFETDRRIRLGVWGLGRGLHLASICPAVNMDVVAGLDLSDHLRRAFAERYPDALVTDDVNSFLSADFDAVLLASFLPNHADDAIACLKAGKHVLCEVTAFMTVADGVRLVEAVEQSGCVYQMVENYPFTLENRWLARRWSEGLFGELMYGEYEYVHEVMSLGFTDITGVPIKPGYRVHSWRSWLHFHYYNTHSLGCIMLITGTRPVEVCALPGSVRLPGFLIRGGQGMGGVAPSLIRMSNGGLARNLMGATTNDSHIQRLWGTKGAAEQVDGQLRLRLGGSGSSPKHAVKPRPEPLDEVAAGTGHGGGDFWVMYHFAREILEGVPGPFNVYTAADCTLAGIQAYRSQVQGGLPQPVPDLRDPAERDRWRDDTFRQPAYDTNAGVFGKPTDDPLANQFTTVARDLIGAVNAICAYEAWRKVAEETDDPAFLESLKAQAEAAYPAYREARDAAQSIIQAYPGTDGARILSEILSKVETI